MIDTSDRPPKITDHQKLGKMRVSRTEPKAEKLCISARLSASILSESAASAAEAAWAANRLREEASIESASFFIACQTSADFSSAASADGLRTAATFNSALPLRRPSSIWLNTTMSRAIASPAARAPGPPARISVTRRAMVPATTTCCSAL